MQQVEQTEHNWSTRAHKYIRVSGRTRQDAQSALQRLQVDLVQNAAEFCSAFSSLPSVRPEFSTLLQRINRRDKRDIHRRQRDTFEHQE